MGCLEYLARQRNVPHMNGVEAAAEHSCAQPTVVGGGACGKRWRRDGVHKRVDKYKAGCLLMDDKAQDNYFFKNSLTIS